MWKWLIVIGIGMTLWFSIGANTLNKSVTTVTDVYRLKLVIKNPRVFDNMQSKGFRKYKTETFYGELLVTYPSDNSAGATIEVKNLYDNNYLIGGKNVTYDVTVDEDMMMPRINLIGNNQTKVFKKPSIMFALVCDPSYNIGDDGEDNTLYIVLAGSGYISNRKRSNQQVISTMRGFLAGTLGCGCTAYGHVSPTRVNGVRGPILSQVDDVAAVWGKWKAAYSHSIIR